MSEKLIDLGAALRRSRRLRKLTQAELAEMAGLSRQNVIDLEANRGRVVAFEQATRHAPIQVLGLPAGMGIGERIRLARGNRPLAQLAKASGVAQGSWRSLERGQGTLAILRRAIEAVASDVRAEAKPNRPKLWRTVHGRTNPDRPFNDHYATPAPIVRLLLDHVDFEGTLLEPCVGQSRVIERVLLERGYHNVTCYDLIGLESEKRDFFDIVETYDAIITNPPFNRHVQFIKHARRVARQKIALLLPLNYLTGKARHDQVWTDKDFPLERVLVMSRGVNFIADDPFADTLTASQLYCAWYIFKRGHVGPPTMQWIDNHPLIARNRTV